MAIKETPVKNEAVQTEAPDGFLLVRSIAERFYRCGRRFTHEPTELPLAELTAEAIERLENDPDLIVTRRQ